MIPKAQRGQLGDVAPLRNSNSETTLRSRRRGVRSSGFNTWRSFSSTPKISVSPAIVRSQNANDVSLDGGLRRGDYHGLCASFAVTGFEPDDKIRT